MNALSKALLFSSGAVGLLVLIFFGAAIEFNAFSVNQIAKNLTEFRFMGYTLSQMIGMGEPTSLADHLVKLKIGLAAYIGLGSLFLLGLSFFQTTATQLKLLSFGISVPLLLLLFSFWIRFMNDDRAVDRTDKFQLFAFTLITYPSAVLVLWYGLHVRRKENGSKSEDEIFFRAQRSRTLPEKNLTLDESLQADSKEVSVETKDAPENSLSEGDQNVLLVAEDAEPAGDALTVSLEQENGSEQDQDQPPSDVSADVISENTDGVLQPEDPIAEDNGSLAVDEAERSKGEFSDAGSDVRTAPLSSSTKNAEEPLEVEEIEMSDEKRAETPSKDLLGQSDNLGEVEEADGTLLDGAAVSQKEE